MIHISIRVELRFKEATARPAQPITVADRWEGSSRDPCDVDSVVLDGSTGQSPAPESSEARP
jgi:hypothetical protein